MEAILLFAAGFIAGAMNAVAGGGSFVSMPTLMSVGLPATIANASSTVALFPGTLSSLWAYRKRMTDIGPMKLKPLVAISLAGGLVGALLLLATPTSVFDKVIPWLLLLATATLVWGPTLRRKLAERGYRIGLAGAFTGQALIAVYGGYFGGAVGVMMMALWTLISELEIKDILPARTLAAGAMNGIAVLAFILAGAVRWPQTLSVLIGAVAGGYIGAVLGTRLPAKAVRVGVIIITAGTTAAFFWRAYR